MIWLWVIVAVVCMVIMLLCFSYIRGDIHFSKLEKREYMDLEINALWGIQLFRFFPIFKIKNISRKIPLDFKNIYPSNSGQPEDSIKPKPKGNMKDRYQMVKLLLQNTAHLYEWLKNTLARMECTELNWTTRVGIGDAPQTAIAAGTVWGIQSSFLGFIMHLVQVKSAPHIEVVPQYHQTQLSTEFSSVAGIRLIFIVWAGVELIWRIIEIKGGLRSWYRIMTKAKVIA